MDPSKCTLLVVDMQNDFCHREGVWSRRGLRIDGMERIVEQLVQVIAFFKGRHIPVIYIREVIIESPEGKAITAGPLVALRPFLREEGLRRGTWGARLLEELPGSDYEIEKLSYSGFYQTPLDSLLQGLDAQYLFFGGVSTNACVDCTARDALTRGYRVYLIEDCMGSFHREGHEATLRSVEGLMEIVSSDEVKKLFEKEDEK
jgi:ureidoacrylate peracid hydrolase